ncbi:type II toxin-antitoxin system RelE/ParE family toxin [Candidatus Woesearchaeota archaeon]|nr:MAG: type II toxin-antitoxin system RelE/ParE family toxin [Candidatus Woesearchaeota archaeon]
MYTLIYTEEFFKQIKKLNKNTQRRIISTLERIRIRPFSHIKKLVGSPYFRLRVGNYRVILDIKKDKLIIYVLEVGHRRSIYK